MKSIVAHIPAKTTKSGTQTWTTAARSQEFNCDDDGRWSTEHYGEAVYLLQDEVIDVCRKASNWSEIKALHFPMFGFSSNAV